MTGAHDCLTVPLPKTAGVLLWDQVRMRDVVDGTSNTMAVGEASSGYARDDTTLHHPFRARWGFSSYGVTRGTVYPMNADCPERSTYYGVGCCHCPRQFRSPHEGGCFLVFADGQVRFLSENMDLDIYRALSTIKGNEVIDDEDY